MIQIDLMPCGLLFPSWWACISYRTKLAFHNDHKLITNNSILSYSYKIFRFFEVWKVGVEYFVAGYLVLYKILVIFELWNIIIEEDMELLHWYITDNERRNSCSSQKAAWVMKCYIFIFGVDHLITYWVFLLSL